ncbi:MAG: histidine phosphatase family protein [Spirochaetaceae bacterium]
MVNRYFIIRHGHSIANEIGKIVSNPDIGLVKYGLTEKGKKQVEIAGASFPGNSETIICSSDFLRASETAEILKDTWNCDDVLYKHNLRERFFGELEGLGDDKYQIIWDIDKLHGDYTKLAIESPAHVAERLKNLFRELDSMYNGKTIILVSHGDSLQILQAIRKDLNPSEHRTLPHLDNAVLREI